MDAGSKSWWKLNRKRGGRSNGRGISFTTYGNSSDPELQSVVSSLGDIHIQSGTGGGEARSVSPSARHPTRENHKERNSKTMFSVDELILDRISESAMETAYIQFTPASIHALDHPTPRRSTSPEQNGEPNILATNTWWKGPSPRNDHGVIVSPIVPGSSVAVNMVTYDSDNPMDDSSTASSSDEPTNNAVGYETGLRYLNAEKPTDPQPAVEGEPKRRNHQQRKHSSRKQTRKHESHSSKSQIIEKPTELMAHIQHDSIVVDDVFDASMQMVSADITSSMENRLKLDISLWNLLAVQKSESSSLVIDEHDSFRSETTMNGDEGNRNDNFDNCLLNHGPPLSTAVRSNEDRRQMNTSAHITDRMVEDDGMDAEDSLSFDDANVCTSRDEGYRSVLRRNGNDNQYVIHADSLPKPIAPMGTTTKPKVYDYNSRGRRSLKECLGRQVSTEKSPLSTIDPELTLQKESNSSIIVIDDNDGSDDKSMESIEELNILQPKAVTRRSLEDSLRNLDSPLQNKRSSKTDSSLDCDGNQCESITLDGVEDESMIGELQSPLPDRRVDKRRSLEDSLRDLSSPLGTNGYEDGSSNGGKVCGTVDAIERDGGAVGFSDGNGADFRPVLSRSGKAARQLSDAPHTAKGVGSNGQDDRYKNDEPLNDNVKRQKTAILKKHSRSRQRKSLTESFPLLEGLPQQSVTSDDFRSLVLVEEEVASHKDRNEENVLK